MEKLGMFLLIGAIGLLVMASQSVYTVLTNWSPTAIDCVDYFRERPRAKWLRLENCELDVENAYQSSFAGLYVTDVFIPVRPVGSRETAIHVLLATDGEQLDQFLDRLKKLSEDSPAEFTLGDREEKLLQQQTVQGLIRYGLEFDDDDEEKLLKSVTNLSKDFVLIDEGKEPDRIQAFVLFTAGLVLLPVSWNLLTRDPSPKTPPGRGPRPRSRPTART